MRMLLDTHAFLWWLDGDKRLPLRVRRAIADEKNAVYVSAASAWEITTKARLGKLPGAEAVAADVPASVTSQGFEALPISIVHAQGAGMLPADHRDPFDRMLIAQAQLENLRMVTNEEAFDAMGVERFWT